MPDRAPPSLGRKIPDFRLNGDDQSAEAKRELLALQHWAEAQRINALSLFEALGEEPASFPNDLLASLSADVNSVASALRKHLKFSIDRQMHMKAKERDGLPHLLREYFESLGILVLRRNELSDYGVSGLCIAEFPLPLIVFAQESPGRTAFTLLHELGHILCGCDDGTGASSRLNPPHTEGGGDRALRLRRAPLCNSR